MLSQLAHRRTEQEIAKRLGIRSGTVRSHKARIRRKLHISPNVRLPTSPRELFSPAKPAFVYGVEKAITLAFEDRRSAARSSAHGCSSAVKPRGLLIENMTLPVALVSS